jgi:hypothetical protein
MTPSVERTRQRLSRAFGACSSTLRGTRRVVRWLRDIATAVRADKLAAARASYLAELRRFYLYPKESYSFCELADLWKLSEADVRELYADELNRWTDLCHGSPADFRVRREDAIGASAAFCITRYHDIEAALGEQFGDVCPELWRTVPVLVRLPRFVAEQLPSTGFLETCGLARRIEDVLTALVRTR